MSPRHRLHLLLFLRTLHGSTFGMSDWASRLPQAGEALPGRSQRMAVPDKHHVNGNRMVEPFPEGTQMALFGMGCFWGAERKFWRQKGVYSTQVGYAGGHTPNPTYKEVCSGRTGHTEAVRVVFEPQNISFEQLLKVFWENHDPTQGADEGRFWPHHDGDPGGSRVLLRRGISPAVPQQESRRLLRPGRDGGFLPHRPQDIACARSTTSSSL
ncbi:mitochondrial peptide methionine sulfoxide reductase isoform X1 [Parus major]|uniref:mitochondrial peptide methionine sulfoxide reductase isoform X1 n=1 Tax=Parus major TaxID=9157 RepID=UPI0007713434|nr:mitochondrial peptide methionine sulfoxide reductase isoform X1 [Parus major]